MHQRVVMELKINLCLCRDVTGCSSIADRSHHSSVGDNDEPSATGNDHTTNETGSDVTDGGVTSQCDGQPSFRSACNSTQTGWQQDCRFVTTSLMLFLVLLNDFLKFHSPEVAPTLTQKRTGNVDLYSTFIVTYPKDHLQTSPYLPPPRKRSQDGATTHCGGRDNCSLLLIYRPRQDERLSRPSCLTYPVGACGASVVAPSTLALAPAGLLSLILPHQLYNRGGIVGKRGLFVSSPKHLC